MRRWLIWAPLLVFAGQSNRPLAQAICDHLGIPLGRSKTEKFTNDNLITHYEESLREGDVFIVQTFSAPVSDSILELMLMIDAAKSASAGRVTAVIPYYSYARSDKKDSPRISIAGRLVADLLQEAGDPIDVSARGRTYSAVLDSFEIPLGSQRVTPGKARSLNIEGLT